MAARGACPVRTSALNLHGNRLSQILKGVFHGIGAYDRRKTSAVIGFSRLVYNRVGVTDSFAAKPSGRFKFSGQVLPYDQRHRHISDKGVPYEFKDAYQLLRDSFADVDRVLKETEKRKAS